jgi:nicotinate-nucleotide adenylyltransferase
MGHCVGAKDQKEKEQQMVKQKIGIYGGSFNPPHKGHTYSAKAAAEQLGLSRLIVVPSGTPPHKRLPDGSPDAAGRLEMARIAFRGIENCEVSDIELNRAGESYTIDTLRALAEEYPGAEFFLIVGSDMFLTLRQWKDADEILHLATPAVTLRRSAGVSEFGGEFAVLGELGVSVETVKNAMIDVSSSELRRGLPLREFSQHIDERVYSYIIEHGLYGVKPDFDWLRFQAYKLLSPERRLHVAGCESEAVRLAKRYGEDTDEAREAAILHDITKKLSEEEQLALCEAYNVPLTEHMRKTPKILHGHTAAELASAKFGVSDDVKSAIKWHTTGRAEMTELEKIIYVADTIEPSRNFDGVDELRELAYRSLDEAALACIDTVIKELRAAGRIVGELTLATEEYLKSKVAGTAAGHRATRDDINPRA